MSERDDLHEMTGSRSARGWRSPATVLQRELDKFEKVLEDQSWQKLGYGTIEKYLDSLNFHDLRILAEDRKRLVALIKGVESVSNRKIAKALGVAHQTVDSDVAGQISQPPAVSPSEAVAQSGQISHPAQLDLEQFTGPPALANAVSQVKSGSPHLAEAAGRPSRPVRSPWPRGKLGKRQGPRGAQVSPGRLPKPALQTGVPDFRMGAPNPDSAVAHAWRGRD
jgi:hypothetical protein